MFPTIIIIYDSLIQKVVVIFLLSIRRITVILYGDSCKSVCARMSSPVYAIEWFNISKYVYICFPNCVSVVSVCSVLTLECDRSHYKLLISELFYFFLFFRLKIRIGIVPVSLECMRAVWVVVVLLVRLCRVAGCRLVYIVVYTIFGI